MKKYNDVIGLLGGMGSYSTMFFFKRLLDSFPAEEEYERPRIILDNYCTLPNKTKAQLYGIEKDILLLKMSESLSKMIELGCNKIMVICYSAHVFIEDLYELVPDLKKNLIDIMDCLVNKLCTENFSKALILTSENTAKIGVFDRYFQKQNIKPIYDLSLCKEYIYPLMFAGEHHIMNSETQKLYAELIENIGVDTPVVLGSTELSFINHACGYMINNSNIIDPIDCALEYLLSNLN